MLPIRLESMSRVLGREYECKACAFLEEKGFVILERNFFSRFGEIDIVAQKESILHFIEVKGSKKSNPIYRITPKKIHRIVQTIRHYLALKHLDMDYCIDGIVIYEDKMEWIENLTI